MCVFVNCIYLVVLNVCIKSAPSINSVECHLLAPQSEEIIAVRFCPSFFSGSIWWLWFGSDWTLQSSSKLNQMSLGWVPLTGLDVSFDKRLHTFQLECRCTRRGLFFFFFNQWGSFYLANTEAFLSFDIPVDEANWSSISSRLKFISGGLLMQVIWLIVVLSHRLRLTQCKHALWWSISGGCVLLPPSRLRWALSSFRDKW